MGPINNTFANEFISPDPCLTCQILRIAQAHSHLDTQIEGTMRNEGVRLWFHFKGSGWWGLRSVRLLFRITRGRRRRQRKGSYSTYPIVTIHLSARIHTLRKTTPISSFEGCEKCLAKMGPLFMTRQNWGQNNGCGVWNWMGSQGSTLTHTHKWQLPLFTRDQIRF